VNTYTNLRTAPARRRILFLDDNDDTCEMLNLILTQAGYEVVVGCSVAEGLRLIRDKQFDFILLDWFLSDGTGLDLCRAVRQFDGNTPIFFYTGMALEKHLHVAIQAGAQGCLVKPVEVETLLSTIADRVGRQGVHE
jgi:DNA-binding response OmpR family regulator